jgi:hypothetical protein
MTFTVIIYLLKEPVFRVLQGEVSSGRIGYKFLLARNFSMKGAFAFFFL